MPTVLRNGRVVPNADEDPIAVETDSKMQRQSRPKPSPYLLLVYPIILAAGSPPVAPLAAGVTSDANRSSFFHRANYFAGKHNIVNLYFVKIGWFWTTLAFALLLLTTRPPAANKARHYTQSLTRYAFITMSWILTTQWLFGAPLIDRSFTITGGHCEVPPGLVETLADLKEASKLATKMTSVSCKAAGGRWRGGHDISGHIFMLYELYIADTHSSHPSVSPAAAAKVAHDLTEEERKAIGGWESETAAKIRVYARYLLWTVVGLDFWMELMTAIWFHTWTEKLSGLLLAAGAIWSVYFLPDFSPAWKGIVGGFD
jgi:hypothetical protein